MRTLRLIPNPSINKAKIMDKPYHSLASIKLFKDSAPPAFVAMRCDMDLVFWRCSSIPLSQSATGIRRALDMNVLVLGVF